MLRLVTLGMAGLALTRFFLAPALAAEPRRIVSFNLCADQLVVALADPQQIAGLSPYAADPQLSVVAEQARAFRRIAWQAEASIALSPDLVFVGSWDRSVTRRMLGKLGFRTEEVEIVGDMDTARAQIARIAALLGHSGRGARMIAELDAAQRRLAGIKRLPYATALLVDRGGYAAGAASLPAMLLAQAGLHPPAGAPRSYGGFVRLEQLLMLRPDLVVFKDPPSVARDQGALLFTHPALRALYPPQRVIALPTRYTLCGGPALIAALNYLADALAPLAAAN